MPVDLADLPERQRLAVVARRTANSFEDRGMLGSAELMRRIARQLEDDHETITALKAPKGWPS